MKKWFNKRSSDRPSQSRGEASATSADTRFLRGQSSSGDRSHGASSEQGEEWQSTISGNRNYDRHLGENGDPIAALHAFQREEKEQERISKNREILKPFDDMTKNMLNSIDDPVSKKEVESKVGLIHKQLLSADDPKKIIEYVVRQMRSEDLTGTDALIKISGKINQYCLNESNQNRGRR